MLQRNLHNQLNELFIVPRQVMSGNIDLENCPHCGQFDIADSVCRNCEKRSDCFWLLKNDQYSSHDIKPLWQYKIALDYAIDYIGVKLDEWQHEKSCQCSICAWLRDAKNVSLDLNSSIKLSNSN